MNTNMFSNSVNPLELSMMKSGGIGSTVAQKGISGAFGHENYNDLNALQSLKYQKGEGREAALDAAAKHFESMFVSLMIKSMRDANKVFSEGNMLQSSQTEFYQQMYDSQLAVSLSTSKGIGLADVIKRQLMEKENLAGEASKEGFALDPKSRFYSLKDYARQPFVSIEKVQQLETTIADIDKKIKELSDDSMIEHDFSDPHSFIASLYPYAKQVEDETGIDARLMLAQSALETGWGKHQIYREDGSPSFNMFGIKSLRDWDGDQTSITTTEYRNGIALKEKASFRAYDSFEDSFRDYANFLNSNRRYQQALDNVDNPKVFASELQKAGYATDPNYADKINSIIDRYMDFSPDQAALGPDLNSNEARPGQASKLSGVGG